MSVTAAVISDTHALLRPSVIEYLKKADLIIHAGDFDDEETLDRIGEFAPMYAVRGNNDWVLASRLPETLRFQIEGLSFIMVHNRVRLPQPLPTVDAVIFGHSHRWYQNVEDGVLWLNPGSCGRRRFGGGLSMALLCVDGRNYTVDKIVLDGAN